MRIHVVRLVCVLLFVPAFAAADGVPTPAPAPKTLAAAAARCAKDDVMACVVAGDLYEAKAFSRDGTGSDQLASQDAYQKACDGGDAEGCAGVAWWHHELRDFAASYAMLEPLCRYSQVGCFLLAEQLANGQGVPIDMPQAIRLYEQTCAAATTDDGCSSGCNRLGLIYRYGDQNSEHHILADRSRAAAYYDRACELDCLNSCDTAAQLHLASDPEKSAAQYRLACDGGFPPSCMELAKLVHDPKQAKQLRARGCRLSNNLAAGCS